MNIKFKRSLMEIGKYFALLVILLFLLFPIYWMLITSFKSNVESYIYPPTFVPLEPTIASYLNLFTENNEFFIYYKNNFIVSGLATVVVTFVSILAGYAISRLKFNWNKYIVAALLVSQMFPIISRMISLYSLMNSWNLINTTVGLVLANAAALAPFSTILMSSFFDGVPKSIEEAAKVDGCGRVRTMVGLAIPLVVPGVLAVGIYSFLVTWDDYLHCVTLIQNDALRTLSTGISLRYLGELSYDWSLVNTISVIGILPILLLFFFFQRYMIKGLTAGAVKG